MHEDRKIQVPNVLQDIASCYVNETNPSTKFNYMQRLETIRDFCNEILALTETSDARSSKKRTEVFSKKIKQR